MHAGLIGLLVMALLQPAIVYDQPLQPIDPHGGVIKGRVLDENGEPVPAVRVAVGKPNTRSPAGFASYSRPVFADDDGYFEIRNVPPGEWVVHAHASRMRFDPRVRTGIIEYESTYYPGVIDPAEAQLISLAPRATVDDIRFTIRRAPRYTLRVPVNLAELDRASLQIVLMSENGLDTYTHTAAAIGDDGHFVASRLKPGTYAFWVRGTTSSQVFAGRRDITLAADTSEPPLELRRAATIAGRVVNENDQLVAPTGLRVSAPFIVENDQPASFPVDSTSVSDDGRFALSGLFGRRGLRLDGLPQPWIVRRMVVGGRELPPTAVIEVQEGQTLDATFVVGRQR